MLVQLWCSFLLIIAKCFMLIINSMHNPLHASGAVLMLIAVGLFAIMMIMCICYDYI